MAVPVHSSAGAVAAAAAAAARRREEEETLTPYNKDDLEGWEFKIVHSNFGRFSNYEIVQKLCQEEARAGWEMVEKFDDQRIRFKRRIDKRSGDRQLDFNPYRTTVGFGEGRIVAIVLVSVAVLVAGILAFVLYMEQGRPIGSRGGMEIGFVVPGILAVVGLLAVVMIAVTRRR